MVPAGGLSLDGSRWIHCRPNFFLPVRVLSRRFRGKLLALLQEAFDDGRLSFHGKMRAFADLPAFRRLMAQARSTEWVVYAKPPFGGPDQVLRYLARYTHRIAISNRRLLSLEDGTVAFRYKDYAHGRRLRTLRLDAVEFIRRFLLHVLPKGFVRIRRYGLLANSQREKKLARCRELMDRGRASFRARTLTPSDCPPSPMIPVCSGGRSFSDSSSSPEGPHRSMLSVHGKCLDPRNPPSDAPLFPRSNRCPGRVTTPTPLPHLPGRKQSP